MSTCDLYTTPAEPGTWDVPAAGAARFSSEYEDGRQRLLDLYQRGKDKQWDAAKPLSGTPAPSASLSPPDSASGERPTTSLPQRRTPDNVVATTT